MSEKARILIVDDDESIRTVLAAILGELGYVVEGVGTGREGIEKTKTHFYNLAFVDVRLPDMEGPQVLCKMKETTPKIRKIIITGYPSLQNAVEALNKGAHAYIMKPFDMKKVIETVGQQLELQKDEIKFSQEKVAEFVKSRVKELEEKIPK
jgi:two-component system, NtrC family, response regulator AtoC